MVLLARHRQVYDSVESLLILLGVSPTCTYGYSLHRMPVSYRTELEKTSAVADRG